MKITGKIPAKVFNCNGVNKEIPCIGMGTFGSDKFKPAQVAEAVKGCIEYGYRLFDCAAVYGNEDLIGEVFSEAVNSGTVKREELFIISKVWNNMHGKGGVLTSCAKTLMDLRTDYVDMFLVHWPFPNHHAPGVAADSRLSDARPFITEEYMACWNQMEKLYDMGLVGSIGMSNMTIPKLEAVLPLCRIKPAAVEMEMHPAFQQRELFNYCAEKNILPIGYCPIGSPNRPERDKTPEDIAATEMPEIIEIAEARGIHPALVCLKWAVQNGQVPIPFSINNYKSNLDCVLSEPLTAEEMEKINKADRNCRLIKGQVFLWSGASGWQSLWDEDGKICGWNDLKAFRNQIDEIDENILNLLLERFAAVKNVAEYKKEHGLEVFQKDREAEVLKNICDKIDKSNKKDSRAYKKYMIDIYETILKTSKSSQM